MKQTIVIASSLMNPNEKLPLILVDKGKTGRYQNIYIYGNYNQRKEDSGEEEEAPEDNYNS